MAKADNSIRSVIVRLMDSTGLSQREFSLRWGVSDATVSKLLSGEQRDVQFEQVKKLVQAFGLNPRVLFQEREPENGLPQ